MKHSVTMVTVHLHNLFDALLTWKEISRAPPGIFAQEDSTPSVEGNNFHPSTSLHIFFYHTVHVNT